MAEEEEASSEVHSENLPLVSNAGGSDGSGSDNIPIEEQAASAGLAVSIFNVINTIIGVILSTSFSQTIFFA